MLGAAIEELTRSVANAATAVRTTSPPAKALTFRI
jgi:hypothetical protein